jgi:hypothetical protein
MSWNNIQKIKTPLPTQMKCFPIKKLCYISDKEIFLERTKYIYWLDKNNISKQQRKCNLCIHYVAGLS